MPQLSQVRLFEPLFALIRLRRVLSVPPDALFGVDQSGVPSRRSPHGCTLDILAWIHGFPNRPSGSEHLELGVLQEVLALLALVHLLLVLARQESLLVAGTTGAAPCPHFPSRSWAIVAASSCAV